MTNKAYIVVNEQQERDVLNKLEQEGLKWHSKRKPTEWVPTSDSYADVQFPYVLLVVDSVSWVETSELEDDEEIVYDGRKESKMNEKYVVSQEFMDELKKWREFWNYGDSMVTGESISDITSKIIKNWLYNNYYADDKESNNRLIAIIRWVNGEDVFEVKKPKRWIVRSKETDDDGDYVYVLTRKHGMSLNRYNINEATRFDTKEEAQSWANAHQEVIEVE